MDRDGGTPASEGRWGATASSALTAFCVVAALHLWCQVVGSEAGMRVTQWVAVPLLGVHLVAAAGRRVHTPLGRATVVALACSAAGDIVPSAVRQELSFLVLIGAFAAAQTAYVCAFWPLRAQSILARRPGLVLAYALAAVVLVALCWPGAGSLRGPMIAYAALLTTMAVLASGVSATAAVGGALFMASDALIALGEFADWRFHLSGLAIMGTYLAAQGLIVHGVLSRLRGEASPPRGATDR